MALGIPRFNYIIIVIIMGSRVCVYCPVCRMHATKRQIAFHIATSVVDCRPTVVSQTQTACRVPSPSHKGNQKHTEIEQENGLSA